MIKILKLANINVNNYTSKIVYTMTDQSDSVFSL